MNIIADKVARGALLASGAKKQMIPIKANELTIPASGEFPPARMLAAVRAIDPADAIPPKSGDIAFAIPWPINSWSEECFWPVNRSVMSAANNDSIAHNIAIANAEGSNKYIRSNVIFCGICRLGKVCGIPPNALPMVAIEGNLKIDCVTIPQNKATTGAGIDRKIVYLLNINITRLKSAKIVVVRSIVGNA